MFDNKNKPIRKICNPLQVTPSSLMEFSIGPLKDTGLYRFHKVIEFNIDGRQYARYVIFSKSEETEYVFEVFPVEEGKLETYLYSLADTVPFSEEFLEVAGQLYLTTPDGCEYTRCIMQECEDRIDGVPGRVRVYNIETEEVEKEYSLQLWDYRRDHEGGTEFLSIEMSEETGLFKIFTGELIEDIFYRFYAVSEQ